MINYIQFPLTVVSIVAVIAASHCIQHAATGQEAGEAASSAPDRINLEFPGGTAAEFINAAREAFGDVNIVGRGPLDQFTVPAVRLHHVRLGDVMSLLAHVASYASDEPGGTGELATRAVGATWVADARVYAAAHVRPGRPPQAASPEPPGAVTRVFSIMEMMSEFNVDDIITSIETALSLELEADPPESRRLAPNHPRVQQALAERQPADLRLHEETGLLIVRGTLDQVETIASVVNALRSTALAKRAQVQYVSRQEHDLLMHLMQREIQELQAELRALRQGRDAQPQSE